MRVGARACVRASACTHVSYLDIVGSRISSRSASLSPPTLAHICTAQASTS